MRIRTEVHASREESQATMATKDHSPLREQIQAVFDRDLTPSAPHPGYETLRKRYLDNGHHSRLIDAYSRILSTVAGPKRVLIVGASSLEGFLLRRLAPELTVEMIGSPECLIYRSPNEYEFSRSTGEHGDREVHTVTRHNIESPTPFAEGSFDLLICLEVIEHLRRDPLATVCEMRRLLAPGGNLFLSTPNLNSANAIRRALEWENPMFFPSFGPPPSGIIHAHEFSVREIALVLTQAGFTIEQLSSFNHVSTPTFDHDKHYRCGPSPLTPPLQFSGNTLNELYTTLSAHPLRGDYLFITARGDGVPNRNPRHPIYCSFE
jgi:SAM-dependent methyltransferase